MKVFIASDHAGSRLKERVKATLKRKKIPARPRFPEWTTIPRSWACEGKAFPYKKEAMIRNRGAKR